MKTKITISLDESILKALKEFAKDSHRSVSQWITDKVLESVKEFQNGSESIPERIEED